MSRSHPPARTHLFHQRPKTSKSLASKQFKSISRHTFGLSSPITKWTLGSPPLFLGASVKPPALASENASTPDFELSVTQRNQNLNVPKRWKFSNRNAVDNKETVILREKPPSGRRPTPQPLRHQSYILAVSDQETGSDTTCWPSQCSPGGPYKKDGGEGGLKYAPPGDSLASIPFIGSSIS